MGPNPHRRRRDRLVRAAVLIASAAAGWGGCYHGSARTVSPADVAADTGWVRVSDVPLVRQSSRQDCGAAALAMVLARWGTPIPAAEILAAHPVAPERGIAAGALRDFARAKGLRAFLIKGDFPDLIREARQNRPVLVGLVQRHGTRGYAHYEVIVGVHEQGQRLLMLDPARGLREDGFEGFKSEWEPAGNLTLIVAGPPPPPPPPASTPASPRPPPASPMSSGP